MGNWKFCKTKKQWIICVINCDFIKYNKNFEISIAEKTDKYSTDTVSMRFCNLNILHENDKGSKNCVIIDGDLKEEMTMNWFFFRVFKYYF